jgi:predicted RNA-binding Zn-ribbon protein involved in translation (DUF1610 family)
MPCPKCGDTDVKVIDPKKWLLVAAGVVGVVAAVLFILKQSTLAQVVAVVSIGITAARLGTEASYTCNHCGHGWRFRSTRLSGPRGFRHDEEAESTNASLTAGISRRNTLEFDLPVLG